ncbi:AzlD domain-containing protein [Ornithinimicrobium humiphilum]|uniref:Branched-subunit amino acid transport protein AzlD n=1 Tax=Ornithinimicrobium humiphilum TaxID=125288 RepID=A0A543KM78_9MICO|nr:AzlD domain-containing protein [Ornithinimicrobium humiphilum]TQM96189.1 branched-subunit amino acid transport protein AzlD [Ornithinimicrobium humiphilum]
MTLWIAVLAAGLLAYLIKLGGYLVPERVLEVPWIERVVPLLTVALLSSLVITQGFLSDGIPTLDARAVGIVVAVVALLLRAPFLVVVASAAVAAALVRALVG